MPLDPNTIYPPGQPVPLPVRQPNGSYQVPQQPAPSLAPPPQQQNAAPMQQPAQQPMQNFTPVNPQSAAEVPNEDPEHFAVWQFLHEQTGDADFAHEGADMHMQQLQQEKQTQQLGEMPGQGGSRLAAAANAPGERPEITQGYQTLSDAAQGNMPKFDEQAAYDTAGATFDKNIPAGTAPPAAPRYQRMVAGISDALTGVGQIYQGLHPNSVRFPVQSGNAADTLEAKHERQMAEFRQAEHGRQITRAQMAQSGANQARDTFERGQAGQVNAAGELVRAGYARGGGGGATKITGALITAMREDAAQIRAAKGTDDDVLAHFVNRYGLTPEQAAGYVKMSGAGAEKFNVSIDTQRANAEAARANAAEKAWRTDYMQTHGLSQEAFTALTSLAERNIDSNEITKYEQDPAKRDANLRAEMDRLIGVIPKGRVSGAAEPAAAPAAEPVLSHDGKTDLTTFGDTEGLILLKQIMLGKGTPEDETDFIKWAQAKGYTNADNFTDAAVDVITALEGAE